VTAALREIPQVAASAFFPFSGRHVDLNRVAVTGRLLKWIKSSIELARSTVWSARTPQSFCPRVRTMNDRQNGPVS